MQLERGSGSIMGSPFKVLLARGTVSNRGRLSKCYSCVVVIRNCGRFSVNLGMVFVVLRLVELVSVRLC